MDNALELTELAQTRPSSTSATSTYQPNKVAVITAIYVANTTGSTAKASIYLDSDGTTYDESTALFFEIEIPANSTVVIDEQTIPITSRGYLATQTDTANALTFTVYGKRKIT